MTTEEMIQAMVSRAKGKTFSVYGTYERQDDEHGFFEVDYDEVEIKDDGEVVVHYDCVFTDHENHATYRESEVWYFDDIPMEEQIDLYEIVMELLND